MKNLVAISIISIGLLCASCKDTSDSSKNKESEFRKYDSESRLWISGYYVMYGYWYKFLQYAERDTSRTVDWSKYQGWGGAETVLNTPFRKWWLQHWKDLFGVENPSDKSKFSISMPADATLSLS